MRPYQIRMMRDDDLDDVVEIVSISVKEGPYQDSVDNPEAATELVASIVRMPTTKVFVAEEEGRVVGIFAFMLAPHRFSREITAVEVIWYVKPEKRQGKPIALELMWAARELAKSCGATRMQLTAPSPEVGKMYEQMHYREVERTYQRMI